MKSVGAMLIHNGPPKHGRSKLREGLECIEEKSNEDITAASERSRRCFGLIQPHGTDDDGDGEGSDPGHHQGELILPLDQELPLHQSPHLQMERN